MSKPVLALIAVGVALVLIAGYWFWPGDKGQSGPSDYDRMVQSAKEAGDVITSRGGKVKDAPNPLGKKTWAVSLSGLTIDDSLLQNCQDLGTIIDLDLSKSTVTDELLDEMNKMQLTSLLLKLDLSHTAVTDAGLDKLDHMVVLRDLNLVGTKCTKAGVDRFVRNRDKQPGNRFHTKVKLN
jgi:hypothetical protein